MKCRVAVPLALLTIAAVWSSAQQTIDPANTHVNDNASFGNHTKAPKRDKAPTARTVSGQVTDETGQVLEGALVTLTNKKTNEKTNFFTKKDGRYRFEDLSFNEDYEVQAKFKQNSSEARKLSQYDHTAQPVRILEIDTETKPSAASANNRSVTPPKQ